MVWQHRCRIFTKPSMQRTIKPRKPKRRRFRTRVRRSRRNLRVRSRRSIKQSRPRKSNMRAIGASHLMIGVLTLALLALPGCIEKVPSDIVESIESLDRQLIESQGAEYAPEAYGRFVKHWVSLRG